MAEHYPISHPVVDSVEQHKAMYVPHYATSHTRVVATEKEGDAPGELNSPCGVAIHEETHHILFVENYYYDKS